MYSLTTARAATDRHPTPAQIKAGNYRKGRLRLHGLDVVVENPKGFKADVKRPGSRGGRCWVGGKGKVRYGTPPKNQAEHGPDNGIEDNERDRTYSESIVEEARREAVAMDHVIRTQNDATDAMYRPDVGAISFIWGSTGQLGQDGTRYRGGEGIAKIIAQRNLEGSDGEAIARRMPNVIAFGEVAAVQGLGTRGERIRITHEGSTAVLSLYRFSKRRVWLVTGWEEDGTPGVNPKRAYAPTVPSISLQVGASRITNLGHDRLAVNPPPKPLTKATAHRYRIDAAGRVFVRAEVQLPGSRGGRYYVDRIGHIRYGTPPHGAIEWALHEAAIGYLDTVVVSSESFRSADSGSL